MLVSAVVYASYTITIKMKLGDDENVSQRSAFLLPKCSAGRKLSRCVCVASSRVEGHGRGVAEVGLCGAEQGAGRP